MGVCARPLLHFPQVPHKLSPSLTQVPPVGAVAVITGSLTVNNVDYAALSNDTILEARFENICRGVIATAEGTSSENVQVHISVGSVHVSYTTVLPVNESNLAYSALTSAVSGDLATNLVVALSTIDGISEVVSGTMTVSNASAPEIVKDGANSDNPIPIAENTTTTAASTNDDDADTAKASLGTSHVGTPAVVVLVGFLLAHHSRVEVA